MFAYVHNVQKIVLRILFYFLLIKQLKKCCLATVTKEKDFGIASISQNDQYILKNIII